jgi:protein-S-isoprenylcysteine O-methyltransferase Ste14
VYVLFLVTFCYMIGFVGNLVVPQSIDTVGANGPAPMAVAIVVNALLLSLFAIQHTIMARPGFKVWWTTIVPRPVERSTFVLATCIVLVLTVWQWRAMPEIVWSVENAAGRAVLYALFTAGWVLVLYATFCIDHFDLFGLRQVVLHLQGKEYTHPGFAMPWIYKLIRNPLMAGFLLAFWATPVMTQGHLLFAILTTGYILVGIQFEERDLIQALGEDYRKYRAMTPMLLPFPRPRVAVPARASMDTER